VQKQALRATFSATTNILCLPAELLPWGLTGNFTAISATKMIAEPTAGVYVCLEESYLKTCPNLLCTPSAVADWTGFFEGKLGKIKGPLKFFMENLERVFEQGMLHERGFS
jgi:hypothetical protein